MAPYRETLDEAIDRVAAGMTAVASDPGLAERLAPRLAHSRPRAGWMLAAAATAAAMVVALVVNGRARPEPLGGLAPAMASAPATPSPSAPATGGVIVTASAPARSVAATSAIAARADREPMEPSVVALAAPPSLTFDDLALPALAVPAVELDQLDVPTLAIDAIGGTDDSKEPL